MKCVLVYLHAMPDLARAASLLQEQLRTSLPPVGIAFLDRAPDGVPHAGASPASCSYWKRAADGEVFWTSAEEHQGCPIGAHTHGVPLSQGKAQELGEMIGRMVQLGYLNASEVPKIPHRAAPLQVAVYAPLSKMPCEPDLVLVRGTAAQLMVLVEAAQAAGAAPEAPAMGRPTCAVLPQALQGGKPAFSLGCVGNRVYTGLLEGEGYVALPAAALVAVSEKLATLARANAELGRFHRARLSGSPLP
jgi:uncharacterized protein (DUF169 family)